MPASTPATGDASAHTHLRDLLLLATLWGASFLFMRLTAPTFGPVAMAALRVAGAALLLLPLLQHRGQLAALRRHWRGLLLVGVVNSALPFTLFGYAALHLTGGLSAIFNAATPLCGAAIAWLWLRERLGGWRLAGVVVGFAGVVFLAWAKATGAGGGGGGGAEGAGPAGSAGLGGPAWAVAACLVAACAYGFAACFTRRHLAAVPSLAVATGSQLFAALALAIPAALTWPSAAPGANAWLAMAALTVLCTGAAYILFFRLIAQAGASYAMTVTLLVPAFAMAWGAVALGEVITRPMLLGCVVILTGTALATGLLPRPPKGQTTRR